MLFLENNVSACKYKEYVLQLKIFCKKKIKLKEYVQSVFWNTMIQEPLV
jgi:hypothetical protein